MRLRDWCYFWPLALVGVVWLLCSCTASLPHRPDTGNHGQGHSPGSACEGQYAMYVVAPTGDRFFLECVNIHD